MILELGILVAGTVVIFCCICRLAMVHFGAHNPLVLCAYIAMAGWASAKGIETLAGDVHSIVDIAGLTAVAVYLLADMKRWKAGVPRSLYRRQGDLL